MASRPSAAVARAAATKQQASPTQANADKLTVLAATAALARDLELEISDLTNQAKEKAAQLRNLYEDRLPSLLDDAKLDHIGVPPQGNKPGVDYKLTTLYAASIAASWPEEKRSAAFDFLKSHGAESLIKTEVTAKLPKGQLKAAKQLMAAAKKLKIQSQLKQSVHAGTLGAWLRELYERNNQSLTPTELAKIGGFVGRVVRPEERKT